MNPVLTAHVAMASDGISTVVVASLPSSGYAQGGDPICMTVTLLDRLELARPAFHHSMKGGSCATLGTGKAVTHLQEIRAVLEAIVERITLAQMHR